MASNPSSMHNDPCQYGMNMSYGSQMFSDVSGGPYRPTGLSSGPDQSMNPGMNNMGSQMGCGMGGGSMMNTSMTSPMNNSMQMNDFNMSNQFPANYSQVPQSRMPQFQPPQRMNSCPSVSTSSQQQLHSPNASMMHPNQNTSMGPPSMVPMAPMMRQFSQPNLPMSHNAGNQMPRPRSSHTMPSHSPGGTRNPLPSPHMPVPSPLAHDMFASPNYPSPMQRSSQTPQNGMALNNQQQQQQHQQQQEMQQGMPQGMQQGMQQGMPGPNSQQQQQQHQHQMMMQQANHPGAGSGMGAMNPNGMPQNAPSVSSQASCAMSSQNMSSCAMSSSGMTSGINTSQGMQSQGMNQGMLAPHSSATMMNHSMSMANSHMMHEFHGYTSFTSHELPPAFPNFKGLVAHVNPKNASMYYDRPRKQLALPYPTGSQVPHPKEPPTFGFMQGNPYYDVRIASMPRPPPSFPTAAAQPAAPATGGNGRKGSYNAATGSGRPPAKKARTTANARTKQQQAAAAAAAAQQEKMMSPMFPNPAMSGMGPMGMSGQMCQMSGGRMGMVPGMNGPMPGGPMSGGPMSGGPMSGSHMPGGPMSAGQMPAHMMHPEGPPQMMMGHPMGQQGMSGSPFGGLPGGSNMNLQKQQSKDNLFQPVPPAYEPLTPGTASSQGDHNSEDGSQQTNGQHMGNMNQPQNAQHQQQQLQKQGMDPMMSMNRMGNQLNHQQATNQMGNHQLQHPQGQHPGQQQPPQGLNKNGMGTDLPKIGDFSAANPFNGYNQGMRSFDLEPNNICAGCRQQIMANSPSVRCCGANDCGRIFHQQCCGLSPMAFEGLCNEKMIKWICRDCGLKQPTGLVTVM